MITLKKLDKRDNGAGCNVCGIINNIKAISFYYMDSGNSTTVRLCEKCRIDLEAILKKGE